MDRAEFSVFLFYEKEGAGNRRLGRVDIALFKVVVDVYFEGVVLGRGEVIKVFLFHDRAWLEFYGMIPGLMSREAM